MKRTVTVLVVAVVTALSLVSTGAGAGQQQCPDQRILRLLGEVSSFGDNRYGLQLYQWERCGQKTGIAFG